jgi:hypothetical protein
VTDIRRILPHQFLLPDEIFMERLARRSLWISVPRTPTVKGYGTSSTEYSPDSFKQKVYLLLDTSTSMASHHRFQMAKAVVYVYLKRNLRELGHVYFRTFDTELGPLIEATDARSLRDLLQHVMRLNRLGNGTVMERAIVQAAEDIRVQAALSGAEMLIVTDGACHLDIERIREALGETIRINTVKIGDAHVFADEKELRDLATRGATPPQKELARLEESLRRAEYDLRGAPTDADRSRLATEVGSMRKRCESLRQHIVGRLREHYGREIETLSSVFVNVADIDTDRIYVLRESEVAEVRELVAEVELDFHDGADADALREAGVLYEHVQFLLKMAARGSEQHVELEQLARRLEDLLKDVLHPGAMGGTGMRGISRSDLRDIQFMLEMSGARGAGILELILAALRRILGRAAGRR